MGRNDLLIMCTLLLLLLSLAGGIGCGPGGTIGGNYWDSADPVREVKHNYDRDTVGKPLPPGWREKVTIIDHYQKGTPPGPYASTTRIEYEMKNPETGQWVPAPSGGTVGYGPPIPPVPFEDSKKSTRALDILTGGAPRDRSRDGGGGGARSGGGGHCFAAGTQVLMADGSLKDIAELAVGDQLLSRDPTGGELRPVAVEKVYQAGQPEHYLINGTLRVTGTHPFMLEQGATRSAAELRPGDVVQGRDATLTIRSAEKIATESEVFNLTVSDTHTFFVSGGDKDIYWVHNK